MAIEIERIIVCVDCGGRAHLLTHLDDEVPPEPGDVLAYRCEDCMDRWDIVVADDEPGDDPGGAGTYLDR